MWEAKNVLKDLALAMKYCSPEIELIFSAQSYLATRPRSTLKELSTILLCFWSLEVSNTQQKILKTTYLKILLCYCPFLRLEDVLPTYEHTTDYSKWGSMGYGEYLWLNMKYKTSFPSLNPHVGSVWLARSHKNCSWDKKLAQTFLFGNNELKIIFLFSFLCPWLQCKKLKSLERASN